MKSLDRGERAFFDEKAFDGDQLHALQPTGLAVTARSGPASIIPDPGPAPTVDEVEFGVSLFEGVTIQGADEIVFGRNVTQYYFVERDGVDFTNNGVIWLEDDPYNPAVSNVIEQRIALGNLTRSSDLTVTNNGLMYVWAQGFADIILQNDFDPMSVTNTGTMIAVSEGIEAVAVQSQGPVFVDNSGVIAAQTLGTFGVIQNEGNAAAILGGSGFVYNQVINRASGQILAEAPNIAIGIQLAGASQSGQAGSSPDTPLLINDGLIQAHGTAAGAEEIGVTITGGGTVDSILVNNGTIRAATAVTATSQVRLENGADGEIFGAVTFGDRDDTIVNNGAITGNVTLGAGNDTVTNAGTLTGNISTGAGTDSITNTQQGRLLGQVLFGDGTNTLINEVGGYIGAGAGQNPTTFAAIIGSAGNDTVIDAGTIAGTIDLGAGNDTLISRAAGSTYTSGSAPAMLGAGNDLLRYEGATAPFFAQGNGGAGTDTFEFAATTNQVFGTQLVGFEVLSLLAAGNYSEFSGYTSIRGGPLSLGSYNITDSINPLANVALGGGSWIFQSSSIGRATGSAGSDFLTIGQDTEVGGPIALNGGNDGLAFEFNTTAAGLGISIDGGAGSGDTLSYNIFDPSQQITDSLSLVTGFEVLRISNLQSEGIATIHLSDITGFTDVYASDRVDLTFRTGNLSQAFVGGAVGGAITIPTGMEIGSYAYGALGWPIDTGLTTPNFQNSTFISNAGSIIGDVAFFDGDDTYMGIEGVVGGTVYGNAGNDTLFGGRERDILDGGAGADLLAGGESGDRLIGGAGDDEINGGSNIDTAVVSGTRAQYTITQTSLGVFEVSGPDGTDTLTAVEFLEFDNETLRLLPGTGVSVNFETADPSVYQDAMNAILDFDGNSLGGNGSWLRIGSADVNGDGDIDQILVNDAIGRFATVGTAPDGLVYFNDNGWAGETRVAGIYIDPLVALGVVEQGSDNDSQRRFQNDLEIENINRVLGADDYDGDGLQEVYFGLTDGTAYLRAIMEADGNIRYANYQSEQEVIDYLNANGFGEETYGDWFPQDPGPSGGPRAPSTASDALPGDLATPFTSSEFGWHPASHEYEFFG